MPTCATGNRYWHPAQCLPFFPRLALHKQNGGSCSNETAGRSPLNQYRQMILYGFKCRDSHMMCVFLGKVGVASFNK